MTPRGTRIARCIVDEHRVRVRSNRQGWRRVGDAQGAFAALCATRPPAERERALRLDAEARAAVVAVARAIELAAADASVASGRTLFVVHAEGGCVAADRAYWESADDDSGALASPLKFAATLPSAVAGQVALVLGIRGPMYVTVDPPASGDRALPLGFRAAVDVLLDLTLRRTPDGAFRQAVAEVRR